LPYGCYAINDIKISYTCLGGRLKKRNELLENAGENTHNVVERMVLEEKGCRTILDIPCGEGAFVKRLSEKNITVHAADCQNIMKCTGAPFQVADMNRDLPYSPETFDGVVCIDGIEHIERPFDFIRECRRVVKPGGFLIISTPNITSLRSRWRWMMTGFHNKCKAPLNETEPQPLHHINMVSLPELRYRLETNGFTIADIATNRTKFAAWVFFFLVPFCFIRTVTVFRKECHGEAQKKIHAEMLRQLFTIPVLFGETLIVKARRK
jgi:2-polyprenyl-3-methyl-5-hydroxy-6-metoxy-1,4-benzoquinol methylase